MWYLVALASLLLNGIPVGIVTVIIVAVIACITKRVVWYWTTIIWVVGLVVGACIFRAFQSDWNTLWHFVGAVIGSGVIVWPIHFVARDIACDLKKNGAKRNGS